MTRAKKSFSSLSDLTRQRPTLPEIMVMARYHERIADDRTIAVIQAANLENSIQECIAILLNPRPGEKISDGQIKELFIRDGAPIGTFSAKIKVAHAMEVFGDKTRSDLDRIRAVRNAFAHARKPIKFTTSAVETVCSQLRVQTLIKRPSEHVYHEDLPWPPVTPRHQYYYATNALQAAFLKIMLPDLPAEIIDDELTPPLD